MTTIDCIIPVYEHTQRYVKYCVESINRNSFLSKNTIIVNSRAHNFNFSQAINYGIQQSRADYIIIMNDDLVVGKDWDKALLEIASKGYIVNPLSNCDYGWRHNYKIIVDGAWLGPGNLSLGAISTEHLMNCCFTTDRQYEVDWVPFFCTMISRDIYNKVGPLNEKFVNGCEDVEWCQRAKKLGYKMAITEKSWVFHYGAVSRKLAESEDYNKYHKEDIENHKLLEGK